MATEFHAYLQSKKQPDVEALTRALSSRGFAFELEGDQPLHERNSDLGLTVDGQSFAIAVKSIGPDSPEWAELAAAAQERSDGETLLKVLKNSNRRLTFVADGDAAKWARDVSRGTALLAVGAFENPTSGTLLYYGG